MLQADSASIELPSTKIVRSFFIVFLPRRGRTARRLRLPPFATIVPLHRPVLAKAFKILAQLTKTLRAPAELSQWSSWDVALLKTIDALHDDLLSRCRARVTLGDGAARFADYETLA